jgi:hypothetical protein
MKEDNTIRSAIGSLTQLAAVGPQDLHIHYNDKSSTTAFKFQSTYSQYTKFGIDISPVYDLKLTCGTLHKFTIPFQKQHLISNITLKVDFPDVSSAYDKDTSTGIHYKNKLGYRLLKNIYIKLDGQIIESYSGQYLYMIHKMETPEPHREALEHMMSVCECDKLLDGSARTLYIPIPIWYTRTMKQFFPLLSLSKQKIEIELELEDINNLLVCENTENVISVKLNLASNQKIKLQCSEVKAHTYIDNHLEAWYYIDYIALDDLERDLYIKNNHSHVYNTVMKQSEKISLKISKTDLHFNIPVKQIMFVLTSHDDFEFCKFKTARLIFGKSTTDTMHNFEHTYYGIIQDYYHNMSHPYEENIYSYSFALNSSISEHNGSVHFGQLKTKILEIEGPFLDKEGNNVENVNIHIYARGYNVLHTQDGYGKVEFKV